MVELSIVIALISIIFVAAVAAINPTRRIRQARDASRKSSLAQIITGLGAYGAQNSVYPEGLEDLVPGELKGLPKTPSGGEFGYAAQSESGGVCTTVGGDCQKVVVYDIYEMPSVACPPGTMAYLAWTSRVVQMGRVCATGLPTPDDVPTND